jgi:hypothetical protein
LESEEQWWISRKSMRRCRFIRGGGGHGEKPVFEAYSRQYNPYYFVFVEEK